MKTKPKAKTKPKPKAPRRYHHGNLRETLIAAGLELIAEQGVRALTLREIGAQVGVSRTAAYRHFTDKAALLGAIREAGFALFADALDAARTRAAATFASRMSAMSLAYVRFAAENPAYYEVMFGASSLTPGAMPHSPSGERAFGILEETIREGQRAGVVRAGSSVALANVVWAQVHGISMLGMAPDLGPNRAGTRFMEFSSAILLRGLA